MKININSITDKIQPIIVSFKRYFSLVFFLVIAGVIGFQLARIGMLANSDPSPEEVTLKLAEVKRPRVNQDVVKILKDLEDNNIEVQSIFKQARDNPFQE